MPTLAVLPRDSDGNVIPTRADGEPWRAAFPWELDGAEITDVELQRENRRLERERDEALRARSVEAAPVATTAPLEPTAPFETTASLATTAPFETMAPLATTPRLRTIAPLAAAAPPQRAFDVRASRREPGARHTSWLPRLLAITVLVAAWSFWRADRPGPLSRC